MNKKISLRMWFSVFFGGIWQFIRNIFSLKNKTPFWRVIWFAITLCIVIITAMLAYEFYERKVTDRYYDSWHERYDPYLSSGLKYSNKGRDQGKSFIYDARTKEKILTGIDWIAVPEDGDSLIIVAKDGKRGFVSRHTARIAIPFRYDAAWSFTDGVAAVCEGDSVYFINHEGKPINGRIYPRKRDYDNYVYHGRYAAIPVNGNYGLTDRNGDWLLPPQYQDIHIGAKNMWYVKEEDKWGVINPTGRFVIPMEYKKVWIHPDNGITVAHADNSQSRYDYDGNLLDEFVFDDIYHMAYYTKELDKDGEQKRAVDSMLKYSAGGYYGLMSPNGVAITPPLYAGIESVAPGVYECEIPGTGDCVTINGKGVKINVFPSMHPCIGLATYHTAP